MPLLPQTTGSKLTVEAAFARRRSSRTFGDGPVSLQQLSQLLWAAQGITDAEGRRTVPSAERCYPLSVLVAAGAVVAAGPALHRYDPSTHAAELVATGDHRPVLERAALGRQPWIGQASVVLVVIADMARIGERFEDQAPHGQRGRRYALIEAGAVAQNVHLQAEALDLGCVVVAGFDDDALIAALQVPAGHEPVAMIAIGHREI